MVPRSPLHGGEMALYQVRRAGDSPRPSLSTFAVLPPPTPGAGSGNGSPRGSRPPELPAGKRGGWAHDSVYPSFRLTSFAPRAVNFAPECPSRGMQPKDHTPAERGSPPPLHFSLDASQTRLSGDRRSARGGS